MRKRRFTANLLESYFFCKLYLVKQGWYESRFKYEPIDSEGHSIPWYTYCFINFLNSKDMFLRDLKVFEYGSGNSTIWWSKRVAKIVSIEHSHSYYQKILKSLGRYNNVKCELITLQDGYAKRILAFQEEFDIIIIDGRERVKSTKNCIRRLSSKGVVIWDNSDRKKYLEAYKFLEENGFKKIDFKGIGPIGHVPWQTSIYYRNNNVLDI